MKPYLFFFVLFFCSTSYGQWEWSNPKPSGYINNKVVFLDAQNGFIINYNSDLLRSSDQGISWHIQENLPFANTIDYKDSTIVIAAFASVYISKDLGQTWDKRTINQPEWFDVQIISRDTILIASVFPDNPTHIFLSVDRGNTWQPINPNLIIRSFCMINSREGFATSYGGIYKTTDGGINWQLQPDSVTNAQPTIIKFKNKDVGFAWAQSNTLLKTVDGGQHWLGAGSIDPVISITFTDTSTVTVVTNGGQIIRSVDNGTTWQSISNGTGYPINLAYYSVSFINQNIAFLVGERGCIFKTTNGGVLWTQYAPTYMDMNAVHFATGSIGFAATWNNMYKTNDAGLRWIQLSLTTPASFDRFRYIHFFNKDTGVAMSEAPVRVYKTYNSGTSWQEINLNIMYNDEILCAFFLHQTIYLSANGAVGKKVLRSANAGETWAVQNSSSTFTEPYFTNLYFTDDKTGYGIYGYYVYKTIDSAKTWNKLAVLPMQLLRYLWFPNATTGYAVGDQSYIVKTSDSGHTWTQIHIDPNNNNIPGDLKQVRFFNHKIGYVITGRYIYRTVTGGNSWKLHGTFAANLTGIEISPDTNSYVYGVNGSILKRSIRTYEVDSLGADSIASCGTKLSAVVTTILSSADSLWFQYGTSGYDNEIAAMPFTINDTSLKVSAILVNLLQNTHYKARLKSYHDVNYYYSDSLIFTTVSQPTPVITLIGATLYSSSPQGNQWYRDNTIIPGAIQSSYTPTQSGSYTVRTTISNCTSAMSSPISYVVTAINDPLLEAAINIFPNPVANTLFIQNNQLKKLETKIFNALGMEVLTQLTSRKVNPVNMQSFSKGIYLVSITEIRTSRSVQKLFIKL